MIEQNVPVPQATLDGWARVANRLRFLSGKLHAANVGKPGEDVLSEMAEKSATLTVSLRDAGATPPIGIPSTPVVALAMLDTPASRKLARLLREAVEAAQEVDRERGYDEPVIAGHLEDMAARHEAEAFGAASRFE